jgi:hypothetical protein
VQDRQEVAEAVEAGQEAKVASYSSSTTPSPT